MIYYHQIYYSWRIWYLDLSFLGICFFESWILDFEILINLWLFDIKKFRRVPSWNKAIMVGDILNLISHAIKEIEFYISLIWRTFLTRLTVYEIYFRKPFKKNSQYLINGESDQKSARNKRDVESNFVNEVCYQI